MNIEIVEYYPIENPRGNLVGTLHVYLVDQDLDFRGILVFYNAKNKSFNFRPPAQQGIDAYTGKKCYYPFLSFTSKERNKDMIIGIKRQGIPYIRAFMKNLNNKKNIAEVGV